ncbi:MAG: hypothetical protein LBS79_01790 [Tannerella sp.]|jgi:hypothetical protein|nr:hypothetical protein [Tannerella sp.]
MRTFLFFDTVTFLPIWVLTLFSLNTQTVYPQEIDFGSEAKAIAKHCRFAGDHREESMWSVLCAAKSGKIYASHCYVRMCEQPISTFRNRDSPVKGKVEILKKINKEERRMLK